VCRQVWNRYDWFVFSRIPCPDGDKFAVVARLVEHFRKKEKGW